MDITFTLDDKYDVPHIVSVLSQTLHVPEEQVTAEVIAANAKADLIDNCNEWIIAHFPPRVRVSPLAGSVTRANDVKAEVMKAVIA